MFERSIITTEQVSNEVWKPGFKGFVRGYPREIAAKYRDTHEEETRPSTEFLRGGVRQERGHGG